MKSDVLTKDILKITRLTSDLKICDIIKFAIICITVNRAEVYDQIILQIGNVNWINMKSRLWWILMQVVGNHLPLTCM